MSLVIDASLTVSWYFEDETTPATEAILDRGFVLQNGWTPRLMRFAPRQKR